MVRYRDVIVIAVYGLANSTSNRASGSVTFLGICQLMDFHTETEKLQLRVGVGSQT